MKPLYMEDSYLKEFEATVESVDGQNVFLSQTAFYPRGGGVPEDHGKLIVNGKEFLVTNVMKQEGKIAHVIEGEVPQEGMEVKGVLDWERRYRLMRMHTAAHIIDAILYERAGALATGNQLDLDQSRIDFSLEKMDPEQIKQFIEEANEAVKKDIEVKIYFLKREEAMKIEGIVKLAKAMPPSVEELRIVEIPGVDIQADGGPQVSRTGEIGTIKLVKLKNKGKSNRRLYYTIEP